LIESNRIDDAIPEGQAMGRPFPGGFANDEDGGRHA
jgi:hypothetical protein